MADPVYAAAIENCHIPFVEATSYPPRGGNLLRPLIDGEPAFSRICEAILRAQNRFAPLKLAR